MPTRRRTLKERLLHMIRRDAETQCWVFTGMLNKGYGQMSVPNGRGGMTSARTHRLSYELFVGAIPVGYQIHHACENKACCNPDHLVLVTDREHRVVDRRSMGNKTHCKRGHPLSGDNVRFWDGAHGKQRICVQCNVIRNREYRADNREAYRVYQAAYQRLRRKRLKRSLSSESSAR